ncbi:MAG TPA: outer membrane beta-barrel family protein, partial [Flavisolibacter sp.]|nr:outer membrane beta-barrel family protein [Flavisolibacter sp.]
VYGLNENISAAYSSLSWSASKKISMKMGLRYEYTNSNLGTDKIKNIVDKHYGNLFPSFFLSNSINENSAVNFSYSRRVTRPTFWNLAPFVIFMDPNTYFSGNPGLQPSITDNINLGYTFRKKLLSLSYSYEANPITNFSPKVDPETNKETLAAENQDSRKTINIGLSLPFDITKWWSLQANINASYQKMNGNYNGSAIILDNEKFNLYATQNFKLPKSFTLSLSGFYQSASLWGIYKFNPVGTLDFGIQKKLPNSKSTFRLNFSNILNTLVFKPEVNLPDKNLVAKASLIFTPPAVRLTFTHNFGSDKIKSKRERSSGTEDEKTRLKLN